MVFNIPEVSFTIFNQLTAKLKERAVDASEVEVFRDIAFKIAVIQNTIYPKLISPTHFLISMEQSIKKEFRLNKKTSTIQNYISTIKGFNAANTLIINSTDCESALQENNYYQSSTMGAKIYEKGIEHGNNLVLQAKSSGSNCISFGTTCKESNFSASLLTAEITSLCVEDCLYFDTSFTKEEKKDIIRKAYGIKGSYPGRTLEDMLCYFGEYDILIIVGGILKAAELKMVILIDSFVASSALLYAYQLNRNVIEYCIFCNQSKHTGQKIIIDYFEKKTILNLDFESNSGLGIPISIPIIEGAINWINEVLA